MLLEIRHLRTLVMLRDTGSVTQAAERLHLTQSALSHQAKCLEDYFGMPLFVRKSRPVRFTPAGHRLLALADVVLPAVASTVRDLSRLAGGETGRLRIAIECHSCFDWLMPTMDAFRDNWPDVEMDILTGFSFNPLPALVRENVDLVVTSDPIEDARIAYQPLFRYHGMLALAKSHPLTARTWIDPIDLANETLITYPVEKERLDVFKHFLTPANVEPRAVRTTELTAMIMQLVASRRGIAALPSWVLTEYLERNYVAARPLGKETFWCTLFAATRYADSKHAFVHDFIKTAKATSFQVLHGIKDVAR